MTYQIKAIFPLGCLSCGWGSAAIVRTTDSGHCSVMSGSRLALLAAGWLLAPAPSRSTGHEMLHAPAVLLESRVTPCCRAAFRGCCSQQQVHSDCRKQKRSSNAQCVSCRGAKRAGAGPRRWGRGPWWPLVPLFLVSAQVPDPPVLCHAGGRERSSGTRTATWPWCEGAQLVLRVRTADAFSSSDDLVLACCVKPGCV